MNRERVPILLIIVIILGGGYVRFAHLSRANFNGDELDHYYAAVSLNEGGVPVLPSGSEYSRGIDITRLVSLTLRSIEPAELAVRLPSAMFGLLNLILIAFVTWRLAGAWAAVWATLLLAIYPEAIVQSRMARFYTYQLNFGLLALLTGWRAVQHAGETVAAEPAALRTRWGWGIATLVLLLLALRVQPVTLSVVAAWSAILLVAALADLRHLGRRAWRTSFPLQALVIGILLCAAWALLDTSTIVSYAKRSQYVASWSGPGSFLAYYHLLSDPFPLLVSFTPLVFLGAWLVRPKLAAYLLVWFLVPMLLHSIALPWKGERYVLLAMPALFIAAGIAAAAAAGSLRRAVATRLKSRLRPSSSLATWLPAACVVVVSLFAIVTTHGFNDARRLPPIPKAIDWRAAMTLIDSVSAGSPVPLGSSIGLTALYYWDRVDFVSGTDFLESTDGDGNAIIRAEGADDFYSGAPVLVTPEAISDRFGEQGVAIIGIDTDRWRFMNIDPDLRALLSSQGTELCRGRCGKLYLYLWEFDGSAPETGDARSDD